MQADLENIPFVKIYGPESMKTSDELYYSVRELVRRLVSKEIAITYTGTKGVPHIVATAAKEFATKGAPFNNIICHVFISMDIECLEDLFNIVSKLEKDPTNKSKIILLDEPGWNIWDRLNILLTELMDRGRIESDIFDKIIPTWNLNDILDYVKLGVDYFKNSDKIEK